MMALAAARSDPHIARLTSGSSAAAWRWDEVARHLSAQEYPIMFPWRQVVLDKLIVFDKLMVLRLQQLFVGSLYPKNVTYSQLVYRWIFAPIPTACVSTIVLGTSMVAVDFARTSWTSAPELLTLMSRIAREAV